MDEIDAALESCLFLEENAVQKGKKEGHKLMRKKYMDKVMSIGQSRGLLLGHEFGYYSEILKEYQVEALSESIESLIKNILTQDGVDLTTEAEIHGIRSQMKSFLQEKGLYRDFRVVCSHLLLEDIEDGGESVQDMSW